MRKLITASARKWAQKQKLPDSAFNNAIAAIELEQSVSDLGSGLYKVRVARPGQGKSGGYRTLIVYRAGVRAIVVFGYAKSDLDNIATDELAFFRKLAKDLLALTEIELQRAIDGHVLYELRSE